MTDETIELIARVAHEVNRAYCRAIGDDTQVPWDDAPDWQRESVREGVRGILKGAFPDAEAQHESWLRRKTGEGWTWGLTKDVEAKTHPALLPYAELPLEQRVKGDLCRAVCTETARALEAQAEAAG